jgi:hypothetical protein
LFFISKSYHKFNDFYCLFANYYLLVTNY